MIYLSYWPEEFMAVSPLLPELERIKALSKEDQLRELVARIPEGDPLMFALGFDCYIVIRPNRRWGGEIELFPELENALLAQARKFLEVAPGTLPQAEALPTYLTTLEVLTNVGYGIEVVDLIANLLAWNKDPKIQSWGLATKFEVIRMTRIPADRLEAIVEEMTGYMENPEFADPDFFKSYLSLESGEPMRRVIAACLADRIPYHLQVHAFRWTFWCGAMQGRRVAMEVLPAILQHWEAKEAVEDFRSHCQSQLVDIVRYAEEHAAIPATVDAIRKAKLNAELEFEALDNLGEMWEEISIIWMELLLDPKLSSYKKTKALQRLLDEAPDTYSHQALKWLLEQAHQRKARKSWLKLAKEYDPDWRDLVSKS